MDPQIFREEKVCSEKATSRYEIINIWKAFRQLQRPLWCCKVLDLFSRCVTEL